MIRVKGDVFMVRKYIRFNYFSLNLTPVELPESMEDREINDGWDMQPLLDYISVRRNPINSVVNVGQYLAEFERETLIYDPANKVYSFQISKLRDTNIPAIKRLGNPKEDLELENDEYIGEFVTIVFDPRYLTTGIQSNIYSLNIPQIEYFLTEMRNNYLQIMGIVDPIPLRVQLSPIIDYSRITAVGNADIYRKISISGSSFAADALAQHGTLNEVSELVGRAKGLKFDLTISLGHAPREESLDDDIIREILDGFNAIEAESRPKVEITAKEDTEAPIEIVNLLEPRLTNRWGIEVENRTNIGHEAIHNRFVEEYEIPRTTIARLAISMVN